MSIHMHVSTKAFILLCNYREQQNLSFPHAVSQFIRNLDNGHLIQMAKRLSLHSEHVYRFVTKRLSLHS